MLEAISDPPSTPPVMTHLPAHSRFPGKPQLLTRLSYPLDGEEHITDPPFFLSSPL
jgi:hypothetical protein